MFAMSMTASPSWMSLTDLGRIYGISAIHCGRALKQNGWRDNRGHPTQGALKAGAASSQGPLNHTNSSLWNTKICGALLEKTGYQQMEMTLSPILTYLLETIDLGYTPKITLLENKAKKEI